MTRAGGWALLPGTHKRTSTGGKIGQKQRHTVTYRESEEAMGQTRFEKTRFSDRPPVMAIPQWG